LHPQDYGKSLTCQNEWRKESAGTSQIFTWGRPSSLHFSASQKRFYRPALQDISADAKILYGLMLDRPDFIFPKRWVDEDGRVFIYYTVQSIMEDLKCGNKKAAKLMQELESGYRPYREEKQGQGKPRGFMSKTS
jgi:hypothetical protein